MIQRERWTGRRAADLDDEEVQRAYAGGYEPGPDGYMVGRDPRHMSPDQLRAMGHAPTSPAEAIRLKCLDCCAGSPNEVRLCVATTCPNWDHRMGASPWKAKKRYSDEQLAAMRERGAALARRSAARASGDDN